MGDLAEKRPVCISVIETFTNIYEFTFVFPWLVRAALSYTVEVIHPIRKPISALVRT
jgi:hypothetical protein